jgi:diaminopimelate decarboxylase
MSNTKKKYERPILQKLNVGLMGKFGSKTEYEPILQIDGVSISRLVEDYGSPLFVISEKTLRNTFHEANRAFKTRYPKVQFAWSYKTNYLNAVCNAYHQLGAWAEVVSGFEYQKAIANGVPGNKIIFNGPDKSKEDIVLAIKNKSLLHIDHLDEMMLIHELANELLIQPNVAIRVNMDTGTFPIWDRFGFNLESGQAIEAIEKLISLSNMNLVGLHCHIGTFMLSPNAYSVATQKMCDLMKQIQTKYKINLNYMDVGGGFASKNTLKGSYLNGADTAPSFDDYAEAICSTLLKAGFTESEMPLLILETGRALIDDAGYLIGTVIANKRLSDGKRSTILDFGVNILFTSFWYNHKISPAQPFSQYAEDTSLFGPLCMNIDVIRENIVLPILNKSDKVVVQSVGAYNMTQWMQFISMRPNVVLIDMNGATHIIRNRETTQTLQQQELTPSHLQDCQLKNS